MEANPSFLAPLNEVLDWRRLVLTSTAISRGVFPALPGSAETIATRTSSDPHSTRILLDALAVWDIVTCEGDKYAAGGQVPNETESLAISQQAVFMQRWGTQLDDRMSQSVLAEHPPRPPGALDTWLATLGVNGKRQAPDMIDRCWKFGPNPKSVLDVAGGHGEYAIEAARRGCDVTLLDLPEVIDVVGSWPSVIESGIQLLPGDVYRVEPKNLFDLVLVFGFTHTQPASKLDELFLRLAAMTSPGGVIVVNTSLRDSGPVPALFAVQMLLTGRGGDTHRLEDYARSITNAGFHPPVLEDLGDRALLLARKLDG